MAAWDDSLEELYDPEPVPVDWRDYTDEARKLAKEAAGLCTGCRENAVLPWDVLCRGCKDERSAA